MFLDLLIGGFSGAISRTITAPLELSKIQKQNKFMRNTTLISVIKKEGFFLYGKEMESMLSVFFHKCQLIIQFANF